MLAVRLFSMICCHYTERYLVLRIECMIVWLLIVCAKLWTTRLISDH